MAEPTDTELDEPTEEVVLEELLASGRFPKGATRPPPRPPLPEVEPLIKCLSDAIQVWILGVEEAALADVSVNIKTPTWGSDIDIVNDGWIVEVRGQGHGNIEDGESTLVFQHTWNGIGDGLQPALEAVHQDFTRYINGHHNKIEQQLESYEQVRTFLDIGTGLEGIWDAPEDRPPEDIEDISPLEDRPPEDIEDIPPLEDRPVTQSIQGNGNVQAGGIEDDPRT